MGCPARTATRAPAAATARTASFTFSSGSKFGAGLRVANRSGKMFDRFRVFVNDAVERPCDSARFAERLYERRIVAPFFGAQLFGQGVTSADEVLEGCLVYRDYFRREIGLDRRLRHDRVSV